MFVPGSHTLTEPPGIADGEIDPTGAITPDVGHPRLDTIVALHHVPTAGSDVTSALVSPSACAENYSATTPPTCGSSCQDSGASQ